MTFQPSFFAGAVVAVLIFTGCEGSGLTPTPEDAYLTLTDMVPCIVTVTDGRTRLDDVAVELHYFPPITFKVHGETNQEGRAEMVTQSNEHYSHSRAGVPPGQFVITLKRTAYVPDWKTYEERKKFTPAEEQAYEQEKERRAKELETVIPAVLREVFSSPVKERIPLPTEGMPIVPVHLFVDVSKYRNTNL